MEPQAEKAAENSPVVKAEAVTPGQNNEGHGNQNNYRRGGGRGGGGDRFGRGGGRWGQRDRDSGGGFNNSDGNMDNVSIFRDYTFNSILVCRHLSRCTNSSIDN